MGYVGVSRPADWPDGENRFNYRLNFLMADVRLNLTDKDIGRLQLAETGWYLARDMELKGFFVVIGKRKKTFTIQADLRTDGQRKTLRIAIGEVGDITTREARAVAKGYLAQIAKGDHPRPKRHAPRDDSEGLPPATTLQSAWTRYREGHLERKQRSEKTIAGYRDHVDRILGAWLKRPLREFGEDPSLVAHEHDRISSAHGPYMANAAMRTFRAIYNHARKTDRSLPAENPVAAVDWNAEDRRNTALGQTDLNEWFSQVANLPNPIRREFHLFTLLSGCRPEALKRAKLSDVDVRRRMLHVARPKGGAAKAFDIPLSHAMIHSLVRARRVGTKMYPEAAEWWLFPAGSKAGHISEHREDRVLLSKWGNDLRQSFRTLAQVAGVSELDARLLMNHAVGGVNSGYITRQKLLDDHLRRQQEAVSKIIMAGSTRGATSAAVIAWLQPRLR